MDGDPAFRRLLRNTLVALLFGAALVALCYYFVDRPFAYFIYKSDHSLAPYLKAVTEVTGVPGMAELWAPVVIIALMVRRAWGPWRRWELTVLTACVALVVAEQFRESLGYVAGRTWPETWVNNNPSLIGDGTFGFHPFHGGTGWDSFPSGHTARTLAVVAVAWVVYPGWQRWAGAVAAAAVAVSLLGMNYHFVGDVVGGGVVGALVGVWAAYGSGLKRSPSSLPLTGSTP